MSRQEELNKAYQAGVKLAADRYQAGDPGTGSSSISEILYKTMTRPKDRPRYYKSDGDRSRYSQPTGWNPASVADKAISSVKGSWPKIRSKARGLAIGGTGEGFMGWINKQRESLPDLVPGEDGYNSANRSANRMESNNPRDVRFRRDNPSY